MGKNIYRKVGKSACHLQDCEDYALYTWRQLLKMGYDARFVVGSINDSRATHAWCEAIIKKNKYIIDPVRASAPFTFKLDFLKFKPIISVSFNNNKIRYFKHNWLTKKLNIIVKILLYFEKIYYISLCAILFLIIFPIIFTSNPKTIFDHIKKN